MLVTDTKLILAEDNASQRRQAISSRTLSSTYKNNSDLDSVSRHPIHGTNMKTKYTGPVKQHVPVPHFITSHVQFIKSPCSQIYLNL